MFRFTRKPSSGSHNQYLAKITHLVKSGYVELVQDVVSVMAANCDLWGVCAQRRCLRLCATNRKVAGSIPDGVNGIFHWRNRMALGLTQPLNRNEYQEYFLGVKGGRCLGLTALPPSWNLGASTSWKLQGLSRPVMGLLYLWNATSTYLHFIVRFFG